MVSRGKLRDISLLVAAKVIFQGSLKENSYFNDGEVIAIDLPQDEQNIVHQEIMKFISKIDEVINKNIKNSKDKEFVNSIATKRIYKFLKDEKLKEPISLEFIGFALLFIYFCESDIQADGDFDFFKSFDNYIRVQEIEEKSEILTPLIHMDLAESIISST